MFGLSALILEECGMSSALFKLGKTMCTAYVLLRVDFIRFEKKKANELRISIQYMFMKT